MFGFCVFLAQPETNRVDIKHNFCKIIFSNHSQSPKTFWLWKNKNSSKKSENSHPWSNHQSDHGDTVGLLSTGVIMFSVGI